MVSRGIRDEVSCSPKCLTKPEMCGEKGKLCVEVCAERKANFCVGTVVFGTIRLEGGRVRETVSCSTSGMTLC